MPCGHDANVNVSRETLFASGVHRSAFIPLRVLLQQILHEYIKPRT